MTDSFPDARSTTAFQGVRVLEFADSGISAAYAGWSLARMGAQVTRLSRHADTAALDPQALPAPLPGSPIALALEVLQDGKAVLPCPADQAGLDALLTDYDVLLCDTQPALEALAGALSDLTSRLPRLVVGIASIFGLDGPYARHPGTALDAQALSAVSWALGEPDREPLALPPGVAEHQAGAMLAAGCLMGLLARDEGAGTGRGRIVDIALSEVLASYVAGNCRLYIHHKLKWQRSGRRASGSGGAYPYVILPCKDGQVCISGRTREEWQRLISVMGHPDWATEPRYQSLRAMGTQYPEEVDALLQPWLSQKTMAELEAIAIANNLILSPIRGFSEVLETRHFTQRGFFVAGQAAGHAVTLPALPFRATTTRQPDAPNIASSLLSTPSTRAPALAAARSATSHGGKPAPSGRLGPLAGLRVLDFGWVWSAPWVGTILGELGAQVIKLEHAARPDNLRLAGKVFRNGQVVEGPTREMSPMFHQINHGKLGITLNAKAPEAVALVKQLVASSDLVIENMSPGSMERVHLGYDTLRAVNPRLVMLAMSAAGQFGDLANMRAYAPTMSSFVGLEALVGYPGETAIGALNFGLGDPNASVHALMAVLAALRHARGSGEGCYIDLSQIEALLGTLRPSLLQAQVEKRQPPPQGNRHPDMAPHGIYPAAGDDRWLTLAITSDAQWQTLARLAPGEAWATEARFSQRAGRLAAVMQLDAAIADWTRRQDRDALAARLRAAGIAASPVLSVEEQWKDPHFEARGIKQTVHIPVYGPEQVFRAPWRFSDFTPQIDAPAPLTGAHNDYVFGELLGLSADKILQLQESGVIS